MSKRITPALTVAECNANLKDIYKKAGKIQLRPWNKSNYTEFEDMHTKISLHKNVRGNRGVDIRKIPLPGSTNDVFTTKFDGCLPYRILLLGAPGYGKTTAISKMAYDWANGFEDCPISHVPLLFVLKLRRIDKQMSLGQAIWSQLLSHIKGIAPEEIERFIDDNEEDCIFLLDGYDEFTGNISPPCTGTSLVQLLSGERFKKCRVVVTSRSHRESDFDTEELSKIYGKIEIEGFDRSDSEAFIGRFFSSSSTEGRDLIAYLNNQNAINPLLSTPFFCMAFCTLWQGRLLDDAQTLTKVFNSLLKYLVHHTRSKVSSSWKPVVAELSPKELKSLIHNLGAVAMQSLLLDSNRVTFCIDDFEHCTDNLEIAVEMGLLTKQTTVQDSDEWYEVSNTYVEFYHKLAQEHCAGIYLASLSPQDLERTLCSIDTEQKVMGLENVLRFAAGSSGDAASAIISNLNNVKWKGMRSHNHRIILDVISESALSKENLDTCLRLHFKSGRLAIRQATCSTLYGFGKVPDAVKQVVS